MINTKTCNRCNTEKAITEFSPTSPYKGEPRWRGECKDCNRANQKKPSAKQAQKKYRSTDKYKETRKEYRSLPEVRKKTCIYDNTKRLSYRKKLFETRYNTDPLFNLKHRLRCRLYDMLRKRKWHKANSFVQYIGCTLDELKKHIQSKFTTGMSWEKVINGEIEIDHIIPLSSANDGESMMRLCHYTNLQPLWKSENRQKSDTISEEYNNTHKIIG